MDGQRGKKRNRAVSRWVWVSALGLSAAWTTAPAPAEERAVMSASGTFTVEGAVFGNPVFSPLAKDINAWSVVYDPYGDKVYWSDIETGEIVRADPDGSSPKVVLTRPGGVIKCLQIDPGNRRLFFIDSAVGEKILYRASLDGTGVKEVFGGFVRPNDAALDPVAGYLFVTDSGVDGLYRVNVGGDLPTGFLIPKGAVGGPWGIAVDPGEETVYLTTYDAGNVISVGYDGGGLEVLGANGNLLRGAVLARDRGSLFVLDASTGETLQFDFATRSFSPLKLDRLRGPRDILFLFQLGWPK